MRRTTKPVKKQCLDDALIINALVVMMRNPTVAQREMCVVVSPNHDENDDNVDGDDMTRIMWTNLNVSSSDCYLDLLLIRQAQSNYQ